MKIQYHDNTLLLASILIGGMAYVEIYVEACGSLFEATDVATKGARVPPSFRYY